MTDPDRSLEQWGEVYESVRPTIRAFVEKLEMLLTDLLDHFEWFYTWADYDDDFVVRAYRARRAGIDVQNPLLELNGFAGVGIVVADLPRAKAAAETIEQELEINRDVSLLPSGDEGQPAVPRYFVSIPKARAELSEWKPYEGLWVNVDVVTLLQRALDHAEADLPYLWRESYPESVQEQIAEHYSLVAAADRRFASIWGAINELQTEYEAAVLRGDLELELNVQSLVAYLGSSDTVAELVRVGIAAGLRPEDDYEVDHLALEQGLLWLLRPSEIETVRELDDFLQNAYGRAGEVFADLVKLCEADRDLWALPDSIVEWLFLVLKRADPETIDLMWYFQGLKDALNTLIGNPVPTRDDD
jgi:GTP pyrophosphokinase